MNVSTTITNVTKRWIRLVVLVHTLAFGGNTLPAQADMIQSLYSTGVNNDGTPASIPSVDQHYQIISSPGLPTTTAYVSANASDYYFADGPNSQWIAPGPDVHNFWAPGVYDYRTTFDLTGFNLSTVTINGQWTTDNQGYGILLNGVATGYQLTSSDVNYLSFTPFTLTSGFQNGINTLDFLVYNSFDPGPQNPDGNNPTALRVEMSGTAEAVPEPPTIVLFGASVLMMMAYNWRLIRRHGRPLQGILQGPLIPQTRL